MTENGECETCQLEDINELQLGSKCKKCGEFNCKEPLIFLETCVKCGKGCEYTNVIKDSTDSFSRLEMVRYLIGYIKKHYNDLNFRVDYAVTNHHHELEFKFVSRYECDGTTETLELKCRVYVIGNYKGTGINKLTLGVIKTKTETEVTIEHP